MYILDKYLKEKDPPINVFNTNFFFKELYYYMKKRIKSRKVRIIVKDFVIKIFIKIK